MRDTKRSIIKVIAGKPARALTCAALAVAFTATPMIAPLSAYAISAETQAQLESAAQAVEDSAAAYDEAVANLEELQAQIDENTAAIAELQEQLPVQQEAASEAMREMYKYQTGSNQLVTMVLNSESMSDFITTCVYMDEIQASNVEAIEELNATQSELEQTQAELDEQKRQLEEQQQAAADALAEAQQLRADAQAQAEAEAALELAAALAAQDTSPAESTEDSNGDNPYNTANQSGQTANTVVTGGAVNWNMSREEFIAEWTGRIDAYLAGSPLAGHGATFATAAWDYGVDPRWSPAISCIESTKGRYCANTCNAWGWTAAGGGFRAFGSWDEGITAHVRYLRNMYGPTLTVAAAQRYCPPTWQDWYNKVGSQMNCI
ncbi:coiled-coil domain-containing protein [Enorma burkinafasonensis]|uniref:coiled-coil domain-containing protein n=1 Tax=Enorma burkinafasonensis TaxID=2590867 RepID=UPI001FE70BC7|nr:hypothetical protein [Enorma burkinafasonensis]